MARLTRLLPRLAPVMLPLWLAACSTNPVTGDRQFTALMPPEQEAAIGAQQHPEMLKEFGGRYEDAKLQAYVDRLGQQLAARTEVPGTRYTFTVLDSPIVNAFALPGGYVYVSRGLMALANSEAELAGVVGHEIGHVTARHSADRYGRGVLAQGGALLAGILLGQQAGQVAQSGAQVALAGFSRSQELQADNLGIRYMTAAGYDPREMAGFLSSMGRHAQLEALLAGQPGRADQFSYLQTHPPTGDRAERATAAAAQMGGANLLVRQSEYMQAIDGMIYGDSAQNGFVRGRVFAHPGMDFRFEVPDGFRLLNSDQAVIGLGPEGSQIVYSQGQADGAYSAADYIANAWAKGVQLGELRSLTIGGLPAATAVTQLSGQSGPAFARLVAISAGTAGRYHRFLLSSPPALASRLDPGFLDTANSFRRLTAAEKAGLKPYRIKVVQVKQGERVADFVARMPLKDHADERFRVLNNIPPGTEPRPGVWVKTIVEG
ncbi:M48 family metalloprotease [Niveispirillum fermenti]|uniref:M48 family metalloprotease n=1 Tax=Niveispirillum fermenti TaxID=1233113 RepID=UPI003A8C02FE